MIQMKVIHYLALAAALYAHTTADWKCHFIIDDDDSTFEPLRPKVTGTLLTPRSI
jgi:hypothetical protein